MMRTTPTGVTIKEAGLEPAMSLLNNRQRRYTQRLLRLLSENPIHQILPVSFRKGGRGAQPGELSENDTDWTQDRRVKTLGQRLANSMASGTDLDFSVGIESTKIIHQADFAGRLIISETKELAFSEAQQYRQTESEFSF